MYVIISPAKQLNFTPLIKQASSTQPMFQSEAEFLVKILQQLSVEELQKLMGISPALAQLNFDRFQQFNQNASQHSKQAMFAFVGDTYKGLMAETFTTVDIKYAQMHLGILSGLYGVLKPLDNIQPYRLEMGAKKFMNENLYVYWGKKVTDVLNAVEDNLIINLASKEYSSVIQRNSLNKQLVDVTFLQQHNGALKNIGLMSKKARGMLARFIVKNQLKELADLARFNEDGYEYDPETSTENSFVFIR